MFEANTRALLRPKAAERSTMSKEIYRNLSIREILVLTLAVRRSSARTDSGEGKGSPKATWRGEDNVIFSWREISRYFWATSIFLGGKSHDNRCF